MWPSPSRSRRSSRRGSSSHPRSLLPRQRRRPGSESHRPPPTSRRIHMTEQRPRRRPPMSGPAASEDDASSQGSPRRSHLREPRTASGILPAIGAPGSPRRHAGHRVRAGAGASGGSQHDLGAELEAERANTDHWRRVAHERAARVAELTRTLSSEHSVRPNGCPSRRQIHRATGQALARRGRSPALDGRGGSGAGPWPDAGWSSAPRCEHFLRAAPHPPPSHS